MLVLLQVDLMLSSSQFLILRCFYDVILECQTSGLNASRAISICCLMFAICYFFCASVLPMVLPLFALFSGLVCKFWYCFAHDFASV